MGHVSCDRCNVTRAGCRWGTDYLLKCHVSEHELYGQVGSPELDHAVWTRPEDSEAARPAHSISWDRPGADLAAETAAAMAAASFLLARDTEYSAELARRAAQLYELAVARPGRYHEVIPGAASSYPSTDWRDEVAWAAAWLHLATEEPRYLAAAEAWHRNSSGAGAGEFSWDDKGPGVSLLLAMVTGAGRYGRQVEDYCEGVARRPRSPRGLVLLSTWGSLRHAANAAFLCLVAARLGLGDTAAYTALSRQQLDYMLGLGRGEGARSFVVGNVARVHTCLVTVPCPGYGLNPPRRPHHAASSCPLAPAPCDWSALTQPGPNPQVCNLNI